MAPKAIAAPQSRTAIAAQKYTAIGATYEAKALPQARREIAPAIDAEVFEDGKEQVKFWATFKDLCDRCDTEDKLGQLTCWVTKQKAYRGHPDNNDAIAIAIAFAEISDRLFAQSH